MNKLTLYEEKENGKEYIVVQIQLDDIDYIPGYIRTTLDNIKLYNRYVKVFTSDENDMVTEYFESSVRSNKKGAAFIDRNGKKYYFINGKQTEETEKLLNNDRCQTLKKILE